MDFIFVFGPQAVGKMTVGQELSKLMGYRLLHNHLTIDIARALYDVKDARFIKQLTRLNFFTFYEFIKQPSANGLVYTDVWALNSNHDIKTKVQMFEMFHKNKWNVYVVELTAPLNERLQRNKTENRLKHKPTKRDYKSSDEALLMAEEKFIFNSIGWDDFKLPRYIKHHLIIDNENLLPDAVAQKIVSELKIEREVVVEAT